MDPRIVRPSVDQEVEEELRFHLDMRVRELVERGWTEKEARAEALRRLGDMERMKAHMREQGRGRDMKRSFESRWDEAKQNVTFAWRQLRRAPAFAATTVLTLGVAIGAGTAVFSVVNAVLLRPLPFPEPDRLSIVWTRYLPASGFDIDKFAISVPEFFDVQDGAPSFERLGLYTTSSRALTGDGEDAERVSVGLYSREVFPVLGVPPLHGRWFEAEEDRPDGPAVTVLGHDLWRTRYGADPGLVGRTILMNGVATEVVGVMPEGFAFPGSARAYVPLGIDRAAASGFGRGAHGWTGIGRRRPEATQADVDAELAVLRARWAPEYEHNRAHFAWSQDLRTEVVRNAPTVLKALLAAVGLVLLVGCANVANLLLARGERRQGEVAVRAALGADRARLARQMVTESMVLAGGGALLGVALAFAGTRWLIATNPEALPRLDEVGLDPLVLAFAVATAFVTALLFGVAPALLASRRAAEAATSSVRSVGSRRRTRLRRALVAGEVALSLVVVILAGLMGRTLRALTTADPGLDAESLVTFMVSLPTAGYPDDAEVPLSVQRLAERLGAVPGVTAVGAGSYLPYSGGAGRWDFELDDRPPRQEGELAWNAQVGMVLPGWFEALGIRLLEGRTFTAADGVDGAVVGVVSETMARTYWPGQSALGKRWGYSSDGAVRAWITVVGVVADQVTTRVDEDKVPQVYLPALQSGISGYGFPRTYRVAVRSALGTSAVLPGIRAAVADFDGDLPLYDVDTMEGLIDEAYADTRVVTNLLSLFAAIALVLAAVGIYGVVSYSVAGRTREIGVRVALGAGRGRVTRMIVGEGALPVVLGLALGLAGAWAARALVASLLYGVSDNDPLTFTLLPAALLVVGVAASLVPALRATRVAPTEALREE